MLIDTNQVLGRTHDALARAHMEQGDAHRAVHHARSAVATVTSAYGQCSLPLAHQLLPLERALAATGDSEEAVGVAGKAQHILNLHFGEQDKSLTAFNVRMNANDPC